MGAGAVVNKNVLPHSLMLGVPAKHFGWIMFAEYNRKVVYFANVENYQISEKTCIKIN